jgi:hypothetical protein
MKDSFLSSWTRYWQAVLSYQPSLQIAFVGKIMVTAKY